MASLIKRGKIYYAQYSVGNKLKRVSLETDSKQIAKEKIRSLETALFRGDDSPLPTKTPISKVVAAYIEHMRTRKTATSIKRDISYLRETFGPICPDLIIKNQKNSLNRKKHHNKHPQTYIEANCFEQIVSFPVK